MLIGPRSQSVGRSPTLARLNPPYRLQAALPTDNTIIIAGDSRATSTGPYAGTSAPFPLRADSGHQVWARDALKGKIDFNHANCIGVGGATTTSFISTYLASAVAATGSSVLITLGVNDCANASGIDLAGSCANIDTIVAALRAADKVVFWNDEWPMSDYTGFRQAQHTGIRDYIRSLNRPSNGFYSIPSWDAIATTPSGTTPKTGALRDTVHLATQGAELIGFADTYVMAPLFPTVDLTARSGVLSGGNFTTSGGSITGTLTNGTVSGVAPSGWTVQVLAGTNGSIVSSVLANPDGDGRNWLQIVVTGVTAPSFLITSGDLSSGWVTNTDYIESTILRRVLAGSSNIGRISWAAYRQSGQVIGSGAAIDAHWGGSATTYTFTADAVDDLLRVPHNLFPTGATQLKQRGDINGIAGQVASFTVQFAMPQLSKYLGTLTD